MNDDAKNIEMGNEGTYSNVFDITGARVLRAMQPAHVPPDEPIRLTPPSPLFTLVAEAVRREAEQIPDVLAAWVSPDGTEFLMQGQDDEFERYAAVSKAASRIQRMVAPQDRPCVILGHYTAGGTEIIEGWFAAFVRQ